MGQVRSRGSVGPRGGCGGAEPPPLGMGTPAAVGGVLGSDAKRPNPSPGDAAGRVLWGNKGLGGGGCGGRSPPTRHGGQGSGGGLPPLGLGTPAVVGGGLVKLR